MSGRSRSRRAAAILVAAAGLLAALSSLAMAEIAQKDGVRVAVAVRMNPTRLPRSGAAPVSVSLASHITATKPGALPKLETIAIAINSQGEIHNRAIPRCRLG